MGLIEYTYAVKVRIYDYKSKFIDGIERNLLEKLPRRWKPQWRHTSLSLSLSLSLSPERSNPLFKTNTAPEFLAGLLFRLDLLLQICVLQPI